jgi:glutathione S-transferase/GST-like protein
MLELYHWEPVSHSLRALICLEEVGVDYERHYVDLLKFEQFSDDFLSMNRAGQVPVLVKNGAAMNESALIGEYLAESFPAAAFAPTDPAGWYEIQTWSKYVDYNLSSSLATLGCRKYLAPLLRQGDRDSLLDRVESIPVVQRRQGWRMAAMNAYPDELVLNSERKVGLVIERMAGTLGKAEWLVGEAYSIADAITFAMVHGLRDVVPDVAGPGKAPAIDAWYERIAKRDAVRRALGKSTRYEPGTVYAPGPEHSRWG